jgi:hypothetical protein
MKIEPNRAPQVEPAAQQEDTTPELAAGMPPRAHRRTTVIVERETVTFLIRRPVVGPADQPAEGASAPEMPDELSGGKP